MKSKSPAFTILSVVLFAAVAIYFLANVIGFFRGTVKTTIVYRDTVEDTIALNGIIVRDEEVFTSSCNALSHAQKEGAKVGVGQVLATGYNSSVALTVLKEIEEYQLQLEQLDFALSSYMDQDASLRLDSSIIEGIIAIHQETKDGEYSVGNSDVSDLKASVMKRDCAYSSQEEIESEIERVQGEIETREKSLGSAVEITSERSGTFSALCDGYESVLTMEFLENVTPETLHDASPEKENQDNVVGKLIYGDTWYYAANCETSVAQEIQDMGTVKLRFAKGFNEEIKMKVDHISEEEDGKCTVVLKTDKYLADTTLMRDQSADIIVKSYEGIRIPTNAIRVNEEGETGVYCVIGVNARFKPVSIIWRGESYSLVDANTSSSGSALLRPGDEVIVSKGDLYDGKVISE